MIQPQHRGLSRTENRGSALLLVLVLLGMAALLALVAARAVSTAAVEMSAAKITGQAEADLRAGVELGAAVIIRSGERMRSADLTTHLADRTIRVHITNERAFIDLNRASREVLSSLFASAGIDKAEAEALAQAVQDWRGGSASQKPTAAAPPTTFSESLLTSQNILGRDESRDTPQQTIGTRYFSHPAQAASIPGFRYEVMAAILPLVTVASGSNQINPFIAPAAVLKALPGVTESAAEAFFAIREDNSSHDLALTMLGVDKASVTEAAAFGWRLEIVSRERSGRTHRSEAVIAVIKEDTEPFRILYVSDH